MNKSIYIASMLLLSTYSYAEDDCSYGIDSTNKSATGNFGVSYEYKSNNSYSYSIESSLSGSPNTVSLGETIRVLLNTTNMPSNAKPNYLWRDYCSGKIKSLNKSCTEVEITILKNEGENCTLQVEIQDGLGNVKLDEISYSIRKKDDNIKSSISINLPENQLQEGKSSQLLIGFNKSAKVARTILLESNSSSLNFSSKSITISANSNGKKIVTITAIDDKIANGNRTATITAKSSQADTPVTKTITIIDNDKENENIDALIPRLGLSLEKTSIIENDTTYLIVTVDKPLKKAINAKIDSSDSALELDRGLPPYTIYIPKGATKSKKISVRMPANRVLNDLRTVTISVSTENLSTNTPTVKLKVYEDSDSSERKSKDIKLLSGYQFSSVKITQDRITRKNITMYVSNTSNQRKSVNVKVIRQEGQRNVLFDKERSCHVLVPAGGTKSCVLQLRFDEDAPSGNHSLKIVGSASGGSYFTEYKTIKVINQLKKRNYSVNLQGKREIKSKLGAILDYGYATVRSNGDGNCNHQLPYKFHLKHLPTNKTTVISQGYVDTCSGSVTLNKQSSIKLSQAGAYKFWAEIYPDSSDTNRADNRSRDMSITVEDASKPDLMVASFNIPSTAKMNKLTSGLSINVRNAGRKRSTATRMGVYISNNSNNGGQTGLSDKKIAFFEVPAISANGAQVFSPSFKATEAGNKWIYACISSTADESNKTNNCSASKPITIIDAPQHPDLEATSYTLASTPTVGQAQNVSMTITNKGQKASVTTTIGFYTSNNNVKDANDSRLVLVSVPAISAGASKTVSGRINFTKSGNAWLFSCVSPVASEQNMGNNCTALKRVTVKGKTFVISSITPKVAELNKPTVFTVKGTNLPSFTLSVDGCKLPVQYPSSSTQVQMRCTPTQSGSKRGYIRNNGKIVKTFSVQINAKANDDFYITSQRLSSSRIAAGSRITARAYQRYNGTSTAYKRPYLGYYLSRDRYLSADDKLLAMDISYLNARRRSNYETASLLIPKATATGQYYVLFVADYRKTYTENNEANNVQAIPLNITGVVNLRTTSIKNKWRQTNLSFGGTNKWILKPKGNGYSNICNTANKCLHVQRGSLQLGAIQSNWTSAQWKFEPAGSGYNRIRNRLRATYIHVEYSARPMAGRIQSGWWSAMWKNISN